MDPYLTNLDRSSLLADCLAMLAMMDEVRRVYEENMLQKELQEEPETETVKEDGIKEAVKEGAVETPETVKKDGETAVVAPENDEEDADAEVKKNVAVLLEGTILGEQLKALRAEAAAKEKAATVTAATEEETAGEAVTGEEATGEAATEEAAEEADSSTRSPSLGACGESPLPGAHTRSPSLGACGESPLPGAHAEEAVTGEEAAVSTDAAAAECDRCEVTVNLMKRLIEHMESTHEGLCCRESKRPAELVAKLMIHIR